jgi:hypothetical protein
MIDFEDTAWSALTFEASIFFDIIIEELFSSPIEIECIGVYLLLWSILL